MRKAAWQLGFFRESAVKVAPNFVLDSRAKVAHLPNFSIENLKLKKYDGFINGSISIVSLNDNSVYTFEKNIVGELEYEQSINERYKNILISQDVSGEKISSNTKRVFIRKLGFGSCFKSCFANHWSNLNWVEKTACVIATEECAAAFLIGCTIECRAELT